MATSSQIRNWWSSYRCRESTYVRVPFPGEGRTWSLYVAAESKPAWDLFIQAMTQTGYLFRESAGGTYNCRKIGGTDTWSLHAYALAVDLNPSVNRYGSDSHDYPPEFIRLVDSIKSVDGTPAFQWGGKWSNRDQMHWQINLSPAQIAAGLVFEGENDMQLPPERRADMQALFNEGVIQGNLNHYFPVEGQPSADLPVEVWVNVTLAAIGGAARLGKLDGSGAHNHDGEYLKGVRGIT